MISPYPPICDILRAVGVRVIGDDKAIRQMFLDALGTKPENHEMSHFLNDDLAITHTPTARRMSQIGG